MSHRPHSLTTPRAIHTEAELRQALANGYPVTMPFPMFAGPTEPTPYPAVLDYDPRTDRVLMEQRWTQERIWLPVSDVAELAKAQLESAIALEKKQ